jgi:hypothetical protein
MKKISRQEAVKLIETAKESGKFFGVEFIKRTDGTLRAMQCRGNVKKHLKGGELAFNPKERGLVVVWDATVEDNTKAYRMINLDALKRVSVAGQEYIVE